MKGPFLRTADFEAGPRIDGRESFKSSSASDGERVKTMANSVRGAGRVNQPDDIPELQDDEQ